jgi:hypothetical protein
VSQNRVLRRIILPRMDEVIKEWGKLHCGKVMICTPHPYLSGDKIK